ncbi:MAG: hypothetical protein ACHQD8_07515 [Chitinophagales bacterium]
MKVISLLLVCIASFFSSYAQIRLDPFYPYSRVTVGIGVGYSQIYGNLNHTNSAAVTRFSIGRNVNEWVNYNVQVQHGGLSDYETKNHWTNGLSAYNTFTAVHIQGRMSIGEIFNAPQNYLAKTLFDFYIGAGGGYMWNNISNLTLKFKSKDKLLITDYNGADIKTSSSNFYLPFCVGINLHLTRRCMFNANYEFSYAFSDYLDGYNFQPPAATNKYNCFFTVMSFGLNFYVGHIGNGKTNSYRTRHNQ